MSPNQSHFQTVLRRQIVAAALGSVCVLTAACQGARNVSTKQRLTIADSLEALVKQAYDFTQPNVTERLLSLYPDSGRVISASAGRVTSTRTVLETNVGAFWQRVGQNMKNPKFLIGSSYVDVLSPDAAVMTFSYSIPHVTPTGRPHTIAGAWTTLWRRESGRWLIVQEHLSDTPESTMSPMVPVDSMSARDSVGDGMPGHGMPGHGRPRHGMPRLGRRGQGMSGQGMSGKVIPGQVKPPAR